MPEVLVVTGLSGAGKSTALGTLADLGYYCVDNLPPSVVPETVRVCAGGAVLPIALGLDVRVGAFLDEALEALETLRQRRGPLAVLFLEAADDVLVRRYSETRRPHPLLSVSSLLDEEDSAPGQGSLAVLDGIALERERLASLRACADLIVDTSHLSVHELRREVTTRFGPGEGAGARMRTRVVSFGFKYGVPLDVDLVFDVRFLDNPHFVPTLRERTGNEADVARFVLGSPGCAEFLSLVEQLLRFLLPRFEQEGKSYLTVAIGCTGGKHRSVATANALAERLDPGGERRMGVVHRDVGRDAPMSQVVSRPGPAAAGPTGTAQPQPSGDDDDREGA